MHVLSRLQLCPARSVAPALLRLTLTLALGFVLVFGLGLAGPSSFAEEKQLIILHTNDFHGHISQENEYAGAARIAALVKDTRDSYPGVLVLDGGDRISGTPVSTMFEGIPIFEVLNLVGYDAGVLGNHEFDHGYRQLLKFRDIASHPLLAANAYAPDGTLLADAPALIKTVNGIKIGIIGLITDRTPYMITPKGNEGISFSPPKDMLRAMVAAMRPQVDLLMVVAHIGHEEEQQLAREVDGVDIIIGGHTHTKVLPPVKVGDTYVAQAGYYGAYVGKITVTVDTATDSLTSFDGTLIPAADLPDPDRKVERLVKRWEKKVARKVDFKIATSPRDYTKEEMLPFLQDIMQEATGADFGYYNMGGIRDILRRGKVTARHIWNIEPFSNVLVTATASGATWAQILQRESTQRQRVASLQEDRMYTVAVSDFVAAQAKKAVGDAITVHPGSVLLRDVLIEYIRAEGIQIN